MNEPSNKEYTKIFYTAVEAIVNIVLAHNFVTTILIFIL